MSYNELLAYVVNEERFADKAVIFRESKGFGKWVYVVLEGQVKIKKKTSKGLLTISTLSEGALLGELMLWELEDKGRVTSAIAHGPVVLGLLDTNRINHEMNSLSPILRMFIHSLALRLRTTTLNISKFI